MPLKDANTAFLVELANQGVKPIHESTPEEVRALTAELAKLVGPGPDVARVEQHAVATADGDSFDVRVLVPHGDVAGVFIYYHGGGWVIGGGIDEFDALGRKLAVATRCAVVLVDYRLAPEHRYPTAVDDASTALEWVADRTAQIAGSAVPIIVGGDSAGGNLAAVVARRARDRGSPQLALQVLVYPVTDADLDTPCYVAEEHQLLLQRESMVWFWGHYAPDVAQRRQPDASPLRATDLSGLPPAIMILAEYDVLRDEGQAYADALVAAGVPVEVHVHEGEMHAFFTLLVLQGHEAAIEEVATAVKGALGVRA
jgi:acetyl esterase